MAGAWGSRLKARAMLCKVAAKTLKLRAWVSSPLQASPGSAHSVSATAEFGMNGRYQKVVIKSPSHCLRL